MDQVDFQDVKEAFPEFLDWNSISYFELIESMGLQILVDEDYGDYQGETLMLVRDKEDHQRHGIINFTWGSCSVCDQLQGCSTYEDLEEVRDGLYAIIDWSEEDPDGSKIIKWWSERDVEALEALYPEHNRDFMKALENHQKNISDIKEALKNV